MELVSTPSERIKELVKGRRETSYEIAQVIGMSAGGFSKIVNGKNSPSMEMTINIAKYFKVSPIYILGFDVPPNFAYQNDSKSPKKRVIANINSKLEKLEIDDLKRVDGLISIYCEGAKVYEY